MKNIGLPILCSGHVSYSGMKEGCDVLEFGDLQVGVVDRFRILDGAAMVEKLQVWGRVGCVLQIR